MRNREALDAVIKAYDVRGVVGEDIDEAFVRDVGAAFASLLREENETTVAIGHDMRPSSPQLADAFAEGVTSQGLDVIQLEIGRASCREREQGVWGGCGGKRTVG